jgi:hypothetical protein
MANDDHIAQLKKGVAAWNAWRKENPDIHPDLRKADLSGADLAGADLFMALLSPANLSGAKASSALPSNGVPLGSQAKYRSKWEPSPLCPEVALS